VKIRAPHSPWSISKIKSRGYWVLIVPELGAQQSTHSSSCTFCWLANRSGDAAKDDDRCRKPFARFVTISALSFLCSNTERL